MLSVSRSGGGVVRVAWRRLLGLCIGGPLLLLSACGGERGFDESRPPVVLVEPVASEVPPPREIALPGRVQAVSQAQLSFQAEGRLVRFHVREGERVQASDVLAELDDADYRVRLREVEVMERNAAADLERRRQLRGEGILSPAAVEQAEGNLASARAERESLERQIAHTRLTAPYDGTVGGRLEEVGAVVGAGQPVVTMVDSHMIDVAVDVPAAHVLRLPLDERLTANGRLLGVDEEVELPLEYAEHATLPDEQSRTYRLVLRGLPPERVNVLPGMAMRVVLQDGVRDSEARGANRDRQSVPTSSLTSLADGEAALWIASADDQASRVPVTVLEVAGERTLIAPDLPEEARIIVAGGHKLSEGLPVQPRRRED